MLVILFDAIMFMFFLAVFSISLSYGYRLSSKRLPKANREMIELTIRTLKKNGFSVLKNLNQIKSGHINLSLTTPMTIRINDLTYRVGFLHGRKLKKELQAVSIETITNDYLSN